MSGMAGGPESRDLDFAWRHCADQLRAQDPDRYFASLFAPPARRVHLHALYAFSLEVARVRESVSEAMTGELRLQWWRDALQGEARGDVKANPVALALDHAITECRLPRQALVDLVDARVFDLYDDPMPDLADLEGYCGETSSALVRLACLVLAEGEDPGPADAAGHAGLAIALTGLLRAFPWHARRGQIYWPAPMLERHGLTREDITTGKGGAGLAPLLAEIRAMARRHLETARSFRGIVPAATRPAYLTLALVPAYFARMETRGYDAFTTPVDLPQWRKQWILWRAARSGRMA